MNACIMLTLCKQALQDKPHFAKYLAKYLAKQRLCLILGSSWCENTRKSTVQPPIFRDNIMQVYFNCVCVTSKSAMLPNAWRSKLVKRWFFLSDGIHSVLSRADIHLSGSQYSNNQCYVCALLQKFLSAFDKRWRLVCELSNSSWNWT